VPEPDVPFPRTVPADAPEPAEAAMDWRAAHLFFEGTAEALAYRMTPEGVTLTLADDAESVHSWAEVRRAARQRRDAPAYSDIRRAP
jgi:hypothetical protein